jgi:hypothetical protein
VSYCRWSANSDVYCYDTGDTWITHVKYGEDFIDHTLADFKARLLQLRALGLRVPDCALTRIEAELADAQNSGNDSN